MIALNKLVLVLNKMWIPVRIASLKRCLKIIFSNKASIVLPEDYSIYDWENWIKVLPKEDEEYISTTRGNVKIPEILVLLKYDKFHRKTLRLTKKNLFIRDSYQCQYTGKKVSRSEADIDHIVPLSLGGKNEWENMVVCSKDINRKKANKTPEQAGLKLIRKPIKPYNDHFLIDPKIKTPESWKQFIKR